MGVAESLVLGQDNLFRGGAILRLKTGAFAALSIDTIEGASSNSARGQTIPCFHRLHLQAYEKRFRECYGVTGVLACVGTGRRPQQSWCPFWCPLRHPALEKPWRRSASVWRRGSESNQITVFSGTFWPNSPG